MNDRHDLARLVEEANARVAAMSPEEREAMWKAQQESWVRGEMGLDRAARVPPVARGMKFHRVGWTNPKNIRALGKPDENGTLVAHMWPKENSDRKRVIALYVLEEPEPDFWAVHSPTGMHIGLWDEERFAEVTRQAHDGVITPLYRHVVMLPTTVKVMVDRFLRWRLPENFGPDGGISFVRDYNVNTPWPAKHEPTGTNLFDVTQATDMVKHLLGIEDAPPPKKASVGEVVQFDNADPQRVCSICHGTGRAGEGMICGFCKGTGLVPLDPPPDDVRKLAEGVIVRNNLTDTDGEVGLFKIAGLIGSIVELIIAERTSKKGGHRDSHL